MPAPGEILCHCGKPLHYSDPRLREFIEAVIAMLGPDIRIRVEGRRWLVPRHYIALHGIKASEIETLGFPEVKSRCD